MSAVRVLHLVTSHSETVDSEAQALPRAKLLSRTGLAISGEESELAEVATALLSDGIAAAGLRQVDLAAVLNCTEGRVRAKLDASNDGAPITLRDLLKLRRRAPAAWRAVLAGLIALGGKDESR